MATVRYRPKKESARKPPTKQRRKQVPRKLETTLADSALGRCIVPPKYVTKFTAIPIVESLSTISIPGQANIENERNLISLLIEIARLAMKNQLSEEVEHASVHG